MENLTPNVLFKLEDDDYVLGMPRLVFVMLAGTMGGLLVGRRVSTGWWVFRERRETYFGCIQGVFLEKIYTLVCFLEDTR